MFDHIDMTRLIVELTLGPVVLWVTVAFVYTAAMRRITKRKRI